MAYNQNNPNGSIKTGGIILNFRRITTGSTTEVLENDCIIQVDFASIHTVNLPSSPQAGRYLDISGGSLTSALNIITINGNGKNVEGLVTKTLIIPYGKMELLYNGTEWIVLSLIS